MRSIDLHLQRYVRLIFVVSLPTCDQIIKFLYVLLSLYSFILPNFVSGESLPYPNGALAAEVVLLIILSGLEAIRLFLAKKGNKTERIGSVVSSLIITVPSMFGCIYLLVWQTYVLRVEVILNALQLGFIAFEVLLAIIACITFAR